MADTRKNILSKNKYWAVLLIVQFLLFYVLSKFDFAVRFFSDLYEWKKDFHIQLFSKASFSVGDTLYILTSIFFLFFIYQFFRAKKRQSLKKILVALNLICFTYQCFWGMLYFQKPLIEKLQQKNLNDNNLKELATRYLLLCQDSRDKVSEDENGVFKLNNILALKHEILKQQHYLPKLITDKKGISALSVKPSIFRVIMSKTGILGYYNPFTAEAQYNPNLPATQTPFTLAHEMSHQMGFAREQEASFVAYLCAKNTQNPDLRYSSQLYVLRSLLSALSDKHPDFVKSIINQYSPGMKRDRAYDKLFYKENQGALNDFFGVTNDLFLKSNQQAGSVTYSYFMELVARYELQ